MGWLTNWMHKPQALFAVVYTLALIGFGTTFALAIAHIKQNNDYVYLIIWFVGAVTLAFALAPAYRTYQRGQQALENKDDK